MSSNFIDYLDSRFNLEYVSGGNQVKLGGGACPFCGEERDDLRLYVAVETGAGLCNHCGVGFSPAKFVMAAEGCSFQKAVKILRQDEDAWAIPDKEAEKAKPGLKFPPMVKVQDCPVAHEYIAGRGMSDEIIEHFALRFAIDNVEINERVYYTKNRVIIPVFDLECKPISWQGRDITGKSKSRYLFPPGFEGNKYVYNAQAIEPECDYLIMAEGAFDCWGWWRSGFKNVVGTFGKKLSEGQLDIIRYLNPKILYVAWDEDANWNKYELVEKIGHIFPNIKIISLGDQDADEMNKEALVDVFTRARSYSWADKILGAL